MYRKVEPAEEVLVFNDLIGKYSPEAVEDNSRWDELAALLYTGGTTGVSKGVMLSHANLSYNAQQFSAWFPDLKPGEERVMGNFPVFHIAGFVSAQNFITWQAWENIMVPRPEPKINIELIKKYKPTFLPGVPVADTDIKIVEVDDPDKELETGEPGEIAVKGPQIMMGYYNKTEETKEALRDGWFLTGDLGKFDENGYLTIVDRKKDMIIAGGYNIYPVELDNVLMGHPKILEACTIGIPQEYRGETVKAFVVAKEGETLTDEEITNYCKENLAAYKVSKIIEFIDELPKSAVGKILRRKLKEMEVEKMEKGI